MFIDLPPIEAAARIEALLPGVSTYAAEKLASSRKQAQEIWARRYPDRPMPHAASVPGTEGLHADSLISFARESGARVDRCHLGESFDRRTNLELLPVVLGDLSDLPEAILVVSGRKCRRVAPGELPSFVLRGIEVTGDISFDGDELFVCSVSPRITVFHHEGWVFDLRVQR